jgi:hypothetical protein
MVLLLLPLSPALSLSLRLLLLLRSLERASERALNRTAIAGRREERLETFCCNIEYITANNSRKKIHTCPIQQIREFLRGGSRRRCKKGGKRWQGLREQVEGVHRRGGGHQITLIVEEEEVEEEEEQQQQQEHLRRGRPWPWEAWHRHLLYLAWVLPFKCIAILQVPNKGSSSVV